MLNDKIVFLHRYRSIILVLSLAIGLFVWIAVQPPESNHPLPSKNPTHSISAGTLAVLSDEGRSIGVGTNVDTLAALIRAGVAKDRNAYQALFENGRAFLVDDGVRVYVTSLQEKTAEVRFLEGYHSLELGYVSRSWLNAVP